ncbi:MAG: hypothetical protein VKI42_03650, partial [Synechococcaceae cyanobacterium]|nr:hypothetical protein [Synechococcaceae cyanobacterium]
EILKVDALRHQIDLAVIQPELSPEDLAAAEAAASGAGSPPGPRQDAAASDPFADESGDDDGPDVAF